jgi:hypothetical protein
MTSILSLDCSKYVGRSYFASAGAMPRCNTWVAQGLWDSDDYAPYFLAFEKWLDDSLMVFKPDVLAFESPIVVARGGWGDGRGSDENNIRRLIGIVSVAELVGARRNLRRFEVTNSTAKSFAGVPTRKPGGMSVGQYKDLMVIAMTALGYSVADSHQADSCAVARVVFDMLGEEA